MATAAIIGLSKIPKKGNGAPAAMAHQWNCRQKRRTGFALYSALLLNSVPLPEQSRLDLLLQA